MPPVTIQTQTFAQFAGDDQSKALLPLHAGLAHEDSVNVYLDLIGRLARILGYLAQGSAYTTDTGGSATKVPGLFPYNFASGGSVANELIGVFDDGADEYELAVSTDDGVNYTLLKDMGSGFASLIPDSAPFGNQRYFTFGKGPVQVYDNSTLGDVQATQSPTPSVAVIAGETGVLTGGYEYKIVAMKDGKVRVAGSVVSSEIQLQVQQVRITWTQSADGDVIGYEIYRTTGTGVLFFKIGYVKGRTTELFDDTDISDSASLQGRILQEHGDPPPDGFYHCEQHQSRMWYLRTNDDPRKGFYSDRGQADQVGAASFIDFTGDGGGADFGTGMTGNYFRSLIVWLEHSIWRVSGTGTLVNNVPDLRREPTKARIGTVSIRSVVKVPAGAIFIDESGNRQATTTDALAFFTPDLDIRIFDGNRDIVISKPKRDLLATVNYAARATIHAVQHPTEPGIVWFLPTGASVVPNLAIMWDYAQGAWFEIDTAPFLSSVVLPNGDVLTGANSVATGGLTYAWWSGNTLNGSDITSTYFSVPVFGFDEVGLAPHRRKRSRRLDLVFAAHDSARSVTVEWFTGYAEAGATAHGSQTISIRDADKSHIQVRVRLKDSGGNYPVAKVGRFKVTDTGSGDPWALDHYIYHFQLLPGMAT